MATSKQRNKHLSRPRKNDAERRKRTKVQIRRLVALGVPEEKLRHMNVREIRALLRHPKKLAKKA